MRFTAILHWPSMPGPGPAAFIGALRTAADLNNVVNGGVRPILLNRQVLVDIARYASHLSDAW